MIEAALGKHWFRVRLIPSRASQGDDPFLDLPHKVGGFEFAFAAPGDTEQLLFVVNQQHAGEIGG